MKKILLIGVPHHNNLGDNALAEAEERFIKDNFPDYDYYEIAEEFVETGIAEIKERISDKDIIFYHGGGNLGDEYLYIEEERRRTVEEFPNNLIIFFPQTIFFKNNMELEKSKKIYNKHKKLVMMAREEISYRIMKKEFKNNKVIKTPDIVTYLNETKDSGKREGLLCLFREDVEAKTTEDEKILICECAKKFLNKIEYSDTACGDPIPAEKRLKKLESVFEKYRKSKLIITDRLHGMIFAAITSTPCIALSTYNHKVKATAKYLAHLGYIKYLEDLSNIEKIINELINTKYKPYDNKKAKQEFNQIVDIVRMCE